MSEEFIFPQFYQASGGVEIVYALHSHSNQTGLLKQGAAGIKPDVVCNSCSQLHRTGVRPAADQERAGILFSFKQEVFLLEGRKPEKVGGIVEQEKQIGPKDFAEPKLKLSNRGVWTLRSHKDSDPRGKA